ncbi:Eisosome assembly protein [Fusarium torreyae]|uniref:Eisosome assembly protein n=1 Tax=Fusarium torreyae TaxID=1237075 RepID=A0A9W8V8Z4_9HYPO|nr:Eisosome assembly protein [Fusarium torreyae]
MIQSQQPTAPAVNNSGRLKYADPRDLPSYPSPGLRSDGAAASAAASLGWSNQKPIELWKPDRTSSASAAAALAKNYKMAPTWEPTSNSAGHKAALLAVGSANAALTQTPSQRNSHEGWGNSAATQAFNTNRANSMRQPDPKTSDSSLHGQKSLAAAKGAMSTTRRRAQSTPSAPDTRNSLPSPSTTRPDALSGAALAHKASLRSKTPTENAGAVPVTTMTRNMFTSHPPVKPEVDERQKDEQLHASAVAMARKMYTQQQKIIDEAKESHGHDADMVQPKPYINLQDAAYKQAQERLAKLEQEHQKNRDYQAYYGNDSSPRRRFTLNKLRRRSSSDGDLEDRQQSERIKQQMSLFSNKLTEVDQRKRQDDRNALLAAAQRNVKARLQGMDEKVYHETGQVNPTLMSEWELKAQQVASASHETRNENKGKIDIGGGRFMDPHEVDAIAAKRMQPLLDDINEKAEVERERLAALKMEEEARKAEQEKHKARDREIKDITKKLRDQEKQEYKSKKAEEKAARAEEKRHAKEERQRARADTVVSGEEAIDDHASTRSEDAVPAPATDSNDANVPTTIDTETSTERGRRKPSDAGTSPTSKVKGWIKNRFSRGKSLGEKDREVQGEKRGSFIGGAALRETGANQSSTSLDNRANSMRDVALAGRGANTESNDPRDVLHDSRGVSPVSSLESDDDQVPAITPPPAIKDPAARESSRDSKFREMMDD